MAVFQYTVASAAAYQGDVARCSTAARSSAAGKLSEVTDRIRNTFTSALSDIKAINHVLREVVDSGDALNTPGDPKILLSIDNFKHAIQERLIASDSFIQASRKVASDASNDSTIETIKEELSKNCHQELKSYLNLIKERMINCRECLENIQRDYFHIHSLATKHKNCIIEASQCGRCMLLTPATAGSGLVGLAGFFIVKLVLSTIKSLAMFPVHGEDHSSEELQSHSQLVKQIKGAETYVNPEYILCLLFGITIGIGFFYLAKRFGFHQHFGTVTAFTQPGVVTLQSVINLLSTFLSRLRVTINGIRDLEKCLSKAIECTPDIVKTDAEAIKWQLNKLQEETKLMCSYQIL